MKWNGRLPESELELMLAVWEAGEEGTTAPGILARLERPLTASALHSYLKRLEEKGFLSCGKEGKTNRYRARVSRRSMSSRRAGRCWTDCMRAPSGGLPPPSTTAGA